MEVAFLNANWALTNCGQSVCVCGLSTSVCLCLCVRAEKEMEKEEEGSQIHITHESHLTPTARNHGPWRKGNSRPQALGELLGDREALYGRWDERLAGVFTQMEKHTDDVQLNVKTLRHKRVRYKTDKQNMRRLYDRKYKSSLPSWKKWNLFPELIT